MMGCRLIFEVRIFSHPDSFILKDIEFYRMPNGLYYPISNKLWTVDGVKDITAAEKEAIQRILCEVLRGVRKKRHFMHQEGKQGTEAYYEYMKAHPVLRGYNKNRILENVFILKKLSEWQSL